MASKKLFLVLLVSVFLVAFVMAEVKGPIVDKVYINVRTNEEIALRDVAEGNTDFFWWGVTGAQINQLDRRDRDRLEIYAVPDSSWSLFINPYPAEAPYIAVRDGSEVFNPMAMQPVRYAVNYLMDRQFIVDEIYGGAGDPMFTMTPKGQPGTDGYNLIPAQLGLTDTGNEQYGLQLIDEAMNEAAGLDELAGRLVKGDRWWMFDGQPVSINFVIRVDDPNRTRIGEYVSRQIQKSGIQVNQLLYDRFRSSDTVYSGNAGNYEWTIYTEGWGAGATRRFWEHIVGQMYSLWYAGYQPGGFYAGGWAYSNPEIEDLTRRANTAQFSTEEEYYELAYKGTELGIQESTRIYVASTMAYYVANKARFNDRFVYGLGDGPNKYSLITADTKDKTLRVTQYSATGALFMGAADPVGTDAFNDTYLINATYPAMDYAMLEHPATAVNIPVRVVPDYDTFVTGEPDQIVVPTTAVYYDPMTDSWKNVEAGTMSQTKTTYDYLFGNYHSGNPMTLVDVLYSLAFTRQMMTQTSEDDLFYNASYESQHRPSADLKVAWDIDWENNRITTYYNYNFIPSMERTAANGAPYIGVSHRMVYIDWTIIEAINLINMEGAASGIKYSLSPGPDVSTYDIFRPSCVADIRAKLNDMINRKHVPSSVKEWLTADQAVAAYKNALAFVNKHNHALIGNGPFLIERYDSVTNFMEYSAFRDPSYPFTSDYWKDYFVVEILEVQDVEIPSIAFAGDDIFVRANVIEKVWPQDVPSPAAAANVKIVLNVGDDSYEFDMVHKGRGAYEGIIPATFTLDLDSGDYVILIQASKEGAVPGAGSNMVVLY